MLQMKNAKTDRKPRESYSSSYLLPTLVLALASCQTPEPEKVWDGTSNVSALPSNPGVDEILAGEFGESHIVSIGYLTDAESQAIGLHCDVASHVQSSNRLSTAKAIDWRVANDLRDLRGCLAEAQYLLEVTSQGAIAGKMASLWGLYLLDRDLYQVGLKRAELAASESGMSAIWGEGPQLKTWDWSSFEVDERLQQIGMTIEFSSKASE